MADKYDYVNSIQEAINMAVAEGRVIRFLTSKSNEELRKEVVDKKGCLLRKPAKEADEVAVIPPGITDFDFNTIDKSGKIILLK